MTLLNKVQRSITELGHPPEELGRENLEESDIDDSSDESLLAGDPDGMLICAH